MSSKTDLKETQCKHLFAYLTDEFSVDCNTKFLDIIDLLSESDQLKLKKVIIKRQLVPNITYHNAIISYLKRNGVEIVYKEA